MCIMLELIFNRSHLYLSINEIKFWYDISESNEVCEEHVVFYSMLTYINITEYYTYQIIIHTSNIFSCFI
jgi:hypothetical protein